ncbi:FG-GAP-like repeat-containing protein [Granulicella tundricola]|uniref:FG-GAP repeat protein n=1 Tax=Granulicella tundricola (strain ATCC BAA-1859 / DSM 23138 / MP5ACTX9) TaxID=1198114 RepID=E8X704_GRATM|nr:FG-GAP-like repeat-containing protein [Granulicella tundricola]ADW71113.1 FG-GAP repeat protein [Granulicella tundricola MP5ACTX9]
MFKTISRHGLAALFATLLLAGNLTAQQTTSATPFSGRPAPWTRLATETPSTQALVDRTSATAYPMAPQPKAVNGYTFPGFVAPLRTGIGNGDGSETFGGVLSADIDGKNGIDVVTIQGDGILTVDLNDGKGNLSQASLNTSGSGANIVQAFVQDLNGDGLPDIVATSNTLPGYFVWMNQGNGVFGTVTKVAITAPTGITVRPIMGAMTVGDVNGDGKADLVLPISYISGSGSVGYTTTMVLYSYTGNGDGTFAAVPKSTLYTIPGYYIFQGGRSIALSDLSHHGALDAVLEMYQPPPGVTNYFFDIATVKGNGDGTFGPLVFAAKSIASTQYGRGSLLVRDFNNDGNPDVLFADAYTTVDICYGVGDGTLQPAVSAIANVGVSSLTAGDFNKDGVLDIITFRGGAAQVYLGTGSGSFKQTPTAQYAGSQGGNQVESAVDFDSDGNLDFFWVDPFYNSINIFLGKGDGTFRGAPAIAPANTTATLPNNTQSAFGFQVLAVGDYNGDGSTDIFAEESGYVDIGLSDRKGGFVFTRSLDSQNLTSVDFVEPLHVDLNGDGKDDIVMATLTGVRVFLSKGDGTLSTPVNTTIPISLGCTLNLASAGDLNGDGFADLVIAYGGNASCYATGTTPSGFAVLLGNGKGGFTSSLFTAFGGDLYQASLADINKDGKLDLVLNDLASGKNVITVIPGNGDGTFNTTAAHVVWTGIYRVSDVQIADTNGDGSLDLMMAYAGQSIASTTAPSGVLNLLGNGDFTFKSPVYALQGVAGQTAVLSDVNGDGLPDYIIPLSTQTTLISGVTVLINAGGGAFNAPILYTQPLDVLFDRDKLIFAGDFNGDGAQDIILGGGAGLVPSMLFLNNAGLSLTLGATSTSVVQGTPVNLFVEPNLLSTGNLSGTVTFASNGASIGTASWNSNVALLSTSSLPLGANKITATFPGDGTHAAASAAPITVTITAPPAAFSLTGAVQSVSVTQGSSASVALTLQANAGFAGPVTFACTNLPAGATCTFDSQTLTLAAGASAATKVTIATTGSASLQTLGPLSIGTGVSLAGLFALLLPTGRSRKKLYSLMMLLVTLAGAASLSGCGGSGNSGTPTGTALVTITATGVSGTTQVVNSILVAVTVANR